MISTTRNGLPTADNAVPRIGLREQNKIAKYKRILEAGRALFNERGYEGTTTQAVAHVAGIGVGTLFSYVRTKEDLLIVVFMDDLQSAVKSSFRKVRAEDPLVDRILTLFDGLLQFHIRNFGLSRYLMREVVNVTNEFTRKKVDSLMQEIHDRVTALIAEEQQDRGYATNIDRLMLSQNCFAIYYDVLQTTINEGGSLDDVEIILRNRLKLQIEPFYPR